MKLICNKKCQFWFKRSFLAIVLDITCRLTERIAFKLNWSMWCISIIVEISDEFCNIFVQQTDGSFQLKDFPLTLWWTHPLNAERGNLILTDTA